MPHDEEFLRRSRSFDALAEDYDTHRPGYSPRVIDQILEYAGAVARDHRGALEVGAGTGKATLAFAARGLLIAALEPGEPMANVLRTRLAEQNLDSLVTVDIGTFEDLNETDGPFGLIYSAQAFHWTDPDTRWQRLVSLLAPGGAAALFWSHWQFDRDHHDAEAIRAAYAAHAPNVTPDLGEVEGGDWPRGEIDAIEELVDLDVREFSWPWDLSTSGYLDLLATLSQYAIMDADRRDALFAALRAALGDRVHLNGWTVVYLARRR